MIPCILHPRGEAKRLAGSTGAAKGLWERAGPRSRGKDAYAREGEPAWPTRMFPVESS
jgi:hypothetical protein